MTCKSCTPVAPITVANSEFKPLQSLCNACIIARGEIIKGILHLCSSKCRVLLLKPWTLGEVEGMFIFVAEACGMEARGHKLVSKF
jgi:hypothetical protein